MDAPIPIEVDLERDLRLDAFLKICGVAPTGGIAKLMIQDGAIEVNGVLELRRGRRLEAGDEVTVEGADRFTVVAQ